MLSHFFAFSITTSREIFALTRISTYISQLSCIPGRKKHLNSCKYNSFEKHSLSKKKCSLGTTNLGMGKLSVGKW